MKPGASLNQLRLFSGSPYDSVVTRSLIRHFGTPFWYVLSDYRRNEHECWPNIFAGSGESLTADPTLFNLTVDLADPDSRHIYKALSETNEFEPIDLEKDDGSYDPRRYFEKAPIESDRGTHSILLSRNNFYIMKSKERLHIPGDVAVEVIAISERIGDIRIHYAGFAHPWFGRHRGTRRFGTPLIFEVRATDMDTRLYDGSLLARVQLFRMSAEAEHESSTYDEQELRLSKVFYEWPEESDELD